MASPRRSIEHSPLRPDGVALVVRIAGGDEGALAALYDATCGLIYGLLLRILGNSAAAEQVLVAVLLGGVGAGRRVRRRARGAHDMVNHDGARPRHRSAPGRQT